MLQRICLLTLGLGVVKAQLIDDFTCPDEFQGFYPHLISCDKYWHCKDGVAELKTCGNGLGFLDTDETFTLEQCAELHLVECSARTVLEPAISTPNCPRLYGTYGDPESCSVFYKCIDGKANRYECPPGLAYDQVEKGCKWADQVPECKNVLVTIDGEPEQFQCPRAAVGAFTKHAHPADCRQYFVCIAGVPREYGCPLGTVFSIGGDEFSGKCTDPVEVPDCKDYYGDLEFNKSELTRAGADTGPVRERVRSNPGTASRNSVSRAPVENNRPNRLDTQEIKRRPAPPALQSIVDEPILENKTPEPVSTAQFRPRPRPRPSRPSLDRLEESIIPTSPPAPVTASPNRLQIITDRTVIPLRSDATTTPTTTDRIPVIPSFAEPAPLPSVNIPEVGTPLASDDSAGGLPDPVPAVPGPNGEEYYYYYYYYDEDETIPADL
jgi:hypothetical protein